MEKKASSFSGQIGFVLAAAGSAVGVGNLWRFPYLAAKDGGGLFLLVYLVLVLTFGFTLLTSDIAIGRRTKQSAIRAYETMRPKWKFLGILTFLVPVLIMTYYAGHRRVDHGNMRWSTSPGSLPPLRRTAILPASLPRRCRLWCSLCCSWA